MSTPLPPDRDSLLSADDSFVAACLKMLRGELDESGCNALAQQLDADAGKRRLYVHLAVQSQLIGEVLSLHPVDKEVGESQDPYAADIMAEVIESIRMQQHADQVAKEAADKAAQVKAKSDRDHRERLRLAQQVNDRPVPRVIIIPKLLAVLGIAAMLGLVAWLGWPKQSSQPPHQGGGPSITETKPAPVYATVVRSLDARWDDGADLWDGSRGLREGRHRLTEGLVEIELNDGVRVVLEAPVSFDLSGTNAMTLVDGRLVATVPQAAIGFTIDTPTAHIIDYGTEFGVHADGQRQTQVHVFRGEVRAAVRTDGQVVSEPVSLLQSQAATIGAGGAVVEQVAFDGSAFERRVVKRLDLVDIVAGGDGTGRMRDIGIDATSGRHMGGLADSINAFQRAGDGQFRPAHGSPFVAGVFVPGATPAVVSLPGGVTLPALPPTDGTTYGLIWCGGLIPADSTAVLHQIPSLIDGVDYASAGHQLISLHTNAGLVIDLDAIRTAYPGYEVVRVTAVIDNTVPETMFTAESRVIRAEFRAFLDSDLALNQKIEAAFNRPTSPIHLDLEPGDARYLTLVATDGGDGNGNDWIVIGDPVIELRPIARTNLD